MNEQPSNEIDSTVFDALLRPSMLAEAAMRLQSSTTCAACRRGMTGEQPSDREPSWSPSRKADSTFRFRSGQPPSADELRIASLMEGD